MACPRTLAMLIIVSVLCHGRYLDKEQKNDSNNQNFVHDQINLLNNPEYFIDDPSNKYFVNLLLSQGIGLNWNCDVCELIIKATQELLKLSVAADWIGRRIAELCTDMKIEDNRVCTGIVNMFQDEVLTVLSKVKLSSSQICGIGLGASCLKKSEPIPMWWITLPNSTKPPVVPPTPPKPESPKLRVLQLSDIHVDFDYKPGSNAECREPLCCHANDGRVQGEPAGHWGDYRYCDTPTWTLENLFHHLSTSEQFDYIIWSGDLPGHRVWNQTRTHQLRAVKYLTNLFQKYFPNKPIFPALGNHEGSPVNSFPPPFVKGNDSITWLYSALASNWTSNENWLPKDTFCDISKGAFYTVLLKPGFRIVSLNMNYCNNQNWWLLLNMTDPDNMLNWFINVLQHAENNKEKVHVLGHIPPGNGACLKAWSWNYYNIVNRYESTITAQFFGHTHHDSFFLFYDPLSNFTRPTNMGYLGPSVTPYQFLNPAYRIYTVDGFYPQSTWAVLDHETTILNLTDVNQPGKQPVWQHEYNAKAQYNMTSLFPTDWDKFLHRMKNDTNLIAKYYRYYFHSSSQSSPCDESCQQFLLCEARSGRSGDPTLCLDWIKDYEDYTRHLILNKKC